MVDRTADFRSFLGLPERSYPSTKAPTNDFIVGTTNLRSKLLQAKNAAMVEKHTLNGYKQELDRFQVLMQRDLINSQQDLTNPKKSQTNIELLNEMLKTLPYPYSFNEANSTSQATGINFSALLPAGFLLVKREIVRCLTDDYANAEICASERQRRKLKSLAAQDSLFVDPTQLKKQTIFHEATPVNRTKAGHISPRSPRTCDEVASPLKGASSVSVIGRAGAGIKDNLHDTTRIDSESMEDVIEDQRALNLTKRIEKKRDPMQKNHLRNVQEIASVTTLIHMEQLRQEDLVQSVAHNVDLSIENVNRAKDEFKKAKDVGWGMRFYILLWFLFASFFLLVMDSVV